MREENEIRENSSDVRETDEQMRESHAKCMRVGRSDTHRLNHEEINCLMNV